MRLYRFLLCFFVLTAAGPAAAWNAAGHRIVAGVAWAHLSPLARQRVDALLASHPEHPRWVKAARSAAPDAVFAEAATWADDIRGDTRFYDEARGQTPTPPIPGLPETARRGDWHYQNLDQRGRVVAGQLLARIEGFAELLRHEPDAAPARRERQVWALPWLTHLVADLHQPLHVDHAEDRGGNRVEIENPFNPRLPFTSLHVYWDDLPGPPWLRGERLARRVARLLAEHPPPSPGGPRQWRDESRRLLPAAYPTGQGGLLPTVDAAFHQHARQTADRQLHAAGYRLASLLENALGDGVPRETPKD